MPLRTNAECLLCLLTREMDSVPPGTPAPEKLMHLCDAMRLICDGTAALTTPELGAALSDMHWRRFGDVKQTAYAREKQIYNERMAAFVPTLRDMLRNAADPLASAIRLARVGNYIDFGADHVVEDALLNRMLAEADLQSLDSAEYAAFRSELATAERLVYVTDNAGEILLDGLLMEQLLAARPGIRLTALVRGGFVLNDATLEDARAVGLDKLVPVVGNGNALPGTVWHALSPEARDLLSCADIIIAKGQANFETLSESGLNIYFLLLCKCSYFVRRFQVPRLTGMFVNERRLPPPPA
jgi:hypothetical protein